nr:hypothetical protein [Tanacetum cinerariifolium]
MAELLHETKLPQALQALCEKLNKYIQEKQEEERIATEQAAIVCSQYWKPLIYYDDDYDEYSIQVIEFLKKSPIAITPVLPTIEPEDSLRIVEANFDPEEDIHLTKKLLTNDSSPRPPKELNSEILDGVIESFSPSSILVEDSDSLMEEIDIFVALDDSIPPGMKNDDYDSKGDVCFLEELLNDYSISIL